MDVIPLEKAYPKNAKVFILDPTWAGFGYPTLVEKVEGGKKYSLFTFIK